MVWTIPGYEDGVLVWCGSKESNYH